MTQVMDKTLMSFEDFKKVLTKEERDKVERDVVAEIFPFLRKGDGDAENH